VEAKVWRAKVGHISLYLLDTNLECNQETDRHITHQLYGGDKHTRIQQEIVLGIGGMRALRELGKKPTVFHMNEGHAAFLVLERMRQKVKAGLSYEAAIEAVAANTVFTTHTPVPAGHDHFPAAMIWDYFSQRCTDLGVGHEKFMRLGGGGSDFNMTRLALIGSRYHNGVSRIHGGVSSQILSDMWPQIRPEESPMDYITNGVHVPTFLAEEWQALFDSQLGYEWRRRMTEVSYWQRLDDLSDHQFWTVHQALKSQLLQYVRGVLTQQHLRNHGSPAHLDRILKLADPLNPNVLVIGFARRFATYKRAALLFENMDWLRSLVNEADRPVLFLFAGKAHPADRPGQELIRRVHQLSCQPEFEGKILMLEGYDLNLARRLVSGCDVWLNNPIYPLEASGTSGMKAAMNGVLNLSVTDGWWDEGYDGTNGWAIKPAPEWYDDARRDGEDSRTLYELLQDKVIPLYYERNDLGYSPGWVQMAKRSIATLLPQFSSLRMVTEYVHKFYIPAAEGGRSVHEQAYAGAHALAAWKSQVQVVWDGVSVRNLSDMPRQMVFGDEMALRVAVNLAGLSPEDVRVELLLSRGFGAHKVHNEVRFAYVGMEGAEAIYQMTYQPSWCGRMEFRVRVYPHHALLTHRFETGRLLWL
ncbi:MAG: alpha-glucan family phosphorylase, partial [Betaproteobacteria bacterium]